MRTWQRGFKIWRACFWGAGGVLLLMGACLIAEGRLPTWITLPPFPLGAANLSVAYYGFDRRRRLAVGIASLLTLVDLLYFALALLAAFIALALSSGTWNPGARPVR